MYGITKRDQKELALVLGRAYGLETYLNVYGPRQALANPYTGVAAIFAARILNGRAPRVFEDGGQIRDLVHVSDVVRATLAAMDAPAAPGHAINVATGRTVTVGELARRLATALDSELSPKITREFRAGDIRHCFADVHRAEQLLGFRPRRSLAEGLPQLAEWVAAQNVREGATKRSQARDRAASSRDLPPVCPMGGRRAASRRRRRERVPSGRSSALRSRGDSRPGSGRESPQRACRPRRHGPTDPVSAFP